MCKRDAVKFPCTQPKAYGGITALISTPLRAASTLRLVLLVLFVVVPVLASDIAAWDKTFSLGLQAASKNDFAKAEAYFTRAVQLAEAFGPDSPRLGSTLNSLGHIYHWRGKNRDAVRVYLRAVRILDKFYGPRSLDVGNVSVNIGRAYFDEEQYAQSERFFRYALSIFETSFGPDSPKIARAAFDAGEANRLLKRYDEALTLLTQAADIRERTSGLMDLDVAAALNSLALVYDAQGNRKQAESLSSLVANIHQIVDSQAGSAFPPASELRKQRQ